MGLINRSMISAAPKEVQSWAHPKKTLEYASINDGKLQEPKTKQNKKLLCIIWVRESRSLCPVDLGKFIHSFFSLSFCVTEINPFTPTEKLLNLCLRKWRLYFPFPPFSFLFSFTHFFLFSLSLSFFFAPKKEQEILLLPLN